MATFSVYITHSARSSVDCLFRISSRTNRWLLRSAIWSCWAIGLFAIVSFRLFFTPVPYSLHPFWRYPRNLYKISEQFDSLWSSNLTKMAELTRAHIFYKRFPTAGVETASNFVNEKEAECDDFWAILDISSEQFLSRPRPGAATLATRYHPLAS